MSKTISFVAKDELAEYLEAEAERRMATISSTAQMLLAEKIREDQRRAAEATRKGGSGSGSGWKSDRTREQHERMESLMEDIKEKTEPEERFPVMERQSEAWYEPDGEKNDYAVEIPEDADNYDAGKTRYYKTASGAAEALRRWYE